MSTDTTPADNQQLFALIAALEQAQQEAAEKGITVYDLRHRGRDVEPERHQYTDETLALIRQAEADIAAEKGGQRAPFGRDFDCCTAGSRHLVDEQGDPQWAGPSLPHPSEATSEEEADELRQGWDDWKHGIEPNQEASL